MSSVECTICPSYLRCPEGGTLEDVENMANALHRIFLICNDCNAKHFIFSSAFDIEKFPWQTIHDDDRLRAPLMDLYNLIERELCESQSTITVVNKYCNHCHLPDKNWCGDLRVWAQSSSCKKCIFVRCACANPHIESIATIKDENQLMLVKFPWLSNSDSKLPTSGEYQYIPPDDWSSRSSLLVHYGDKYGYIDANGHVWIWDKTHKDHWDVTDPITNNYKKITPEGKIL